jgi:hypothetical protein
MVMTVLNGNPTVVPVIKTVINGVSTNLPVINPPAAQLAQYSEMLKGRQWG